MIRRLLPLAFLAAVALSGGCASITNPVADGIPVARLPEEVLGRPKADLKPIPLTVLRQKDPDPYRLDKGDVLAVVADDIIAPNTVQPPVRLPDAQSPLASVGFPVPVNEDGAISLPRLPAISVKGKTVGEVEKLILDAATGGNGGPKLVNAANARITVQLLQRRSYNVTVVREDSTPVPIQAGSGSIFTSNKRGLGYSLRLPAGENDVLHALNASGGPPGLDAKNEIIIERGQYDPTKPNENVVRIPLRLFPEQVLTLNEADIILKDGDVVRIESRDTASEVYYVAGVAGSRQFTLPRDYDLNVLEALAIAGAPLVNGGFTQNAFIAQAVNSGLGAPSPALLTILRPLASGRQIPIRVDLNRALRDPRERIRVQPGDVLVMQERPGDAAGRYLTQTIRVNTAAETIRNGSLTQSVTGTNP